MVTVDIDLCDAALIFEKPSRISSSEWPFRHLLQSFFKKNPPWKGIVSLGNMLPMILFMLQQFLELIAVDPRLLRDEVYTEIGQLVETHCRILGPQMLPVEIKQKVEALLRIEIASDASGIGSYDGCAALLEPIYARGLFVENDFEGLALKFLNAAVAQMAKIEAGGLVRAVEMTFEEYEGEERQERLLGLMMGVYLDCTAQLSSDARHAFCQFVNGAIDCEKDRRIVESYEELANLTAIIHWYGLSQGDVEKGNCIRLVQLLQALPGIGDHIDFERHDCLNGRRNIFKEAAAPPEEKAPFYDGEF